MIVLDASAVVDVLLRTPVGLRVAERISDRGLSWHAVHLLGAEVTHVLRREVQRGEITVRRGEEALADHLGLRIDRHGHEPLLRRVWELREDLSAYDALYVALAESLRAPLVTTDARLAGAPGHRAVVRGRHRGLSGRAQPYGSVLPAVTSSASTMRYAYPCSARKRWRCAAKSWSRVSRATTV